MGCKREVSGMDVVLCLSALTYITVVTHFVSIALNQLKYLLDMHVWVSNVVCMYQILRS